MAYPCGSCGKNCVGSCIACERCDQWFHIRCQKISKPQLVSLTSTLCDFYCFGCTYDNGVFNYRRSLDRLEQNYKKGSLGESILVEKILLRKENMEPINERSDLSFRADNFIVDRVSLCMLQSLGMNIQGKSPIDVSGDGNCLFNAISMAMFGHENLSCEIRVKTCIEMFENKSLYERNHQRLLLVSPSIEDACRETSVNFNFSSAWAMVAAATVIGCPIQSVYPPQNGFLDKAIGILNETFHPLGKRSQSEPILILWTSTSLSTNLKSTWLPNHFVPLIGSSDISVIDLDSEEEFPQLASPGIVTRKPVKAIFKDNFDTDHQPRDSKMIHNIKSKLTKDAGTGYRQNTADDMQAVINMTSQPHPFVREVVQSFGKPPNIICYTDNQLNHLSKSMQTSIIGIDRTFNLGACFVTTVFQDFDLLRKGKDVSPIILGPVFLHWDGSFHTYQRFFTHLAAVLDNPLKEAQLGSNDLCIGSDEEKALVKAIKLSFPDSKFTLCTRHLEENLKRQLKNKIGMPESQAKKIVHDIFGVDGLTSLNTSVAFSNKSKEIEEQYKNVGPYLTDKLLPSIKEYVHAIHKADDRVPINWKNNHCESMNHILKLNVNWKPSKLPDLINMLEKEILHQEALVRGALYGHGDFELAPAVRCLQISLLSYKQKNQIEKTTLYNKFLKFRRRRKVDNHLMSTDGRLVIPKTTALAKKPGQHKRVKNSKTVTQKRQRTE